MQVIDNSATSYEYGSGPIAVKMLADLKVNYVLAVELGPGVSKLLEDHGIKRILVKPNMKIADTIRGMLNEN